MEEPVSTHARSPPPHFPTVAADGGAARAHAHSPRRHPARHDAPRPGRNIGAEDLLVLGRAPGGAPRRAPARHPSGAARRERGQALAAQPTRAADRASRALRRRIE
eukprot:6302631-Prymnesium_polylepis.1